MSKRITAAEARQFAGPTVEERVDEVLNLIEKVAKEGKRFFHIHDTWWVTGAYSHTNDYNSAAKILTDLGFEVSFFYEERQFVDMYVVVKW